jgi:hypothetical protein
MRSILLLSLVGALSAPAAAGDISFGFGYRDGGRQGVAVRFGYSNGHRQYVPGHYETVRRQVWVAGACEQIWQPAQYGWRHDHCGHRVRYLIRAAGYVTVQRPGHYDTVCEQVWVPGHYVRC